MASLLRLAGVSVVASAFWIAAGLVGGVFGGGVVWAQGKAIQTQEANISGLTYELTEMRRRDGVLSIRIRIVNSSNADQNPYFANWDQTYVTAGKQKFMILRDKEGGVLASQSARVAKGGSTVWWAKFPAPGPEVKRVNLFTPHTPPFEDVPITD